MINIYGQSFIQMYRIAHDEKLNAYVYKSIYSINNYNPMNDDSKMKFTKPLANKLSLYLNKYCSDGLKGKFYQ